MPNDKKSTKIGLFNYLLWCAAVLMLLFILYIKSPEQLHALSLVLILSGGFVLYFEAAASDEVVMNVLSNFGNPARGRFLINVVHFIVFTLIAANVNWLILMPYYDVRYSWIINLPDRCRVIGNKNAALALLVLFLIIEPGVIVYDLVIGYSLRQQKVIKALFVNGQLEDSQNNEISRFRALKKIQLQNYGIWLIFLGTFIDLANIILRDSKIPNVFRPNF